MGFYFNSSLYIYILLLLSPDDNRSIYIEMEKEKSQIKMPCKGKLPWKKGFLQGTITTAIGAWHSFGVVKCLK